MKKLETQFAVRQLAIVLTTTLMVIAASTTAFAEEDEAGTVMAEAPKIGLEKLSFGYSFGNRLGMSVFHGRPSLKHSLNLSANYELTDKESLSFGIGGRGEPITNTRGTEDMFFISDGSLSVSSSRMPKLELGDELSIGFSPSASLSIPTSASSRKVTAYYTSLGLSLPASIKVGGVGFGIGTSLSYTFYRHTGVVFESADNDSQNGSNLSPLSAGISASVNYKISDVRLSSSYGFNKSRSYANQSGDSYWRDFASFRLSASYSINPLLNVSLGYSYANDPLNRFGDLRMPFFDTFADYHNHSRLSLGLSGSLSPFSSES